MKEGVREQKGGAAAAARNGTWKVAWNMLLLGSLLGTNLLTLYSLTVMKELDRFLTVGTASDGATSLQMARLAQEVAALRQQVEQGQATLSSKLESRGQGQGQTQGQSQKPEPLRFPPELTAYAAMRRLPLGRNPASGQETMVSPVGHACYDSIDLLREYMTYTVGAPCPDDWSLGQRLMLRGCEPLPRRRCLSHTPPASPVPRRLHDPLWSTPPDDAVSWSHYSCKSFACLQQRASRTNVTFSDCLDCFNLDGLERERWVRARDRLDFSIEEVVRLGGGGIQVGLDLGGGSGSFAARFKPYNVTVVTSTLNLGGPFNEFVALRGLPPLYVTVAQRLPFFDNTLDLVHSMHVLSYWIPDVSLEFLLFDVDRVLRPGGFLWVDHFFATSDSLQSTFVPMIRRLGYLEHKWATADKRDPNGVKNQEVYLSALLEKPVRSSP